MIGKKIVQKVFFDALNSYEKHSLPGKKKDEAVSFLENGSEKTLKQFVVERD